MAHEKLLFNGVVIVRPQHYILDCSDSRYFKKLLNGTKNHKNPLHIDTDGGIKSISSSFDGIPFQWNPLTTVLISGSHLPIE